MPQLKMNLISVGALKVLDLEVSIRGGVLNMIKGSMVVMKGVWHNNFYYLKSNTVTGKVVTSIDLDDDCIRLWHMRLHTGEIFFASSSKASLCNHYFVSFIDDYSKRYWVYTLKYKEKVLELFVEWRRNMKKNTWRKIKVLHSENDGEYTNDPFLQRCHNEGIKRYFTVRETLQ